jgi:hypothetical protein
MYDSAVGHEVRGILKAIAVGNASPTESDVAALRTRVYAAVDELKAMGWPIERIIVRLKEVADEVGIPRLAMPLAQIGPRSWPMLYDTALTATTTRATNCVVLAGCCASARWGRCTA